MRKAGEMYYSSRKLLLTRTACLILFYFMSIGLFVLVHQKLSDLAGYILLIVCTLLFMALLWYSIEYDLYKLSVGREKKLDIESAMVRSVLVH
jgi:hypothetical protein